MTASATDSWRYRFELAFGYYRTVRFWLVVGGLILHIIFLIFGIGVSFFEERIVNSYVRGFGSLGIVLGIISATQIGAPTKRQIILSFVIGLVFLCLFLIAAASSHSDVVRFWPIVEIVRDAMIKLGWIAIFLVSLLYAVSMLYFVKWIGLAFRPAKPAKSPSSDI